MSIDRNLVRDAMTTAGRARGLLRTLLVRAAARFPGEDGPRAHVKVGVLTLTAALGRTGTTARKREGDKATPRGRLEVCCAYYRPDRLPRPRSHVPLRAMRRNDGWCDDANSPLYNRAVRLPLEAGHEEMWRDDGLYDLVLALDHNMRPRRRGGGSAIFLHCAKGAYRPTLGCVALRSQDLRKLLPRLAKNVRIVIV